MHCNSSSAGRSQTILECTGPFEQAVHARAARHVSFELAVARVALADDFSLGIASHICFMPDCFGHRKHGKLSSARSRRRCYTVRSSETVYSCTKHADQWWPHTSNAGG